MADFVFNVGKGVVADLLARVDGNDPANSAIILVPLSASGTEAQGQDLDTLADVEADANFAEQTGGGWVRKTLTDANFAPTDYVAHDGNNRFQGSLPSVTWTAPAAASNTTGLLVCYDPDTTGGTDADIIPLTHHTFAVTADGNDVVLNAGEFLRAS
jgi:hypothetical protein